MQGRGSNLKLQGATDVNDSPWIEIRTSSNLPSPCRCAVPNIERMARLVGSLILGTGSVFWLALDPGLLLVLALDAWFGDHTLFQRCGMTLFSSVPIAIHSCGGIAFLGAAIECWCSPYRLILDGNGQLIFRSLPGRQRIGVKDIQTVELEQKDDEPFHQESVSST
jgi:hypothetical protein